MQYLSYKMINLHDNNQNNQKANVTKLHTIQNIQIIFPQILNTFLPYSQMMFVR